jgi:hypothetical protein
VVIHGVDQPECNPGDRRGRKSLPRPFTVLDAMVFIAATALALAVARLYAVETWEIDLGALPWVPRIVLRTYLLLVVAMPFPLSWSLAVFLLSFRSPRPPLSRLVRRPGFIASGAVSLVDLIRLAGFLILGVRMALKSNNLFAMDIWEALTIPFRIRGPVTGRTIYSGPYFSTTAFGASTAVAVAWILLAAGRRWRPEPNWLDRTGRVLGWFWVAMIPFSCWWDYNVFY